MDPCVFSKFNPALHGKSGTNVTGKGYKRSITINTDMSWHVHIAGKLVPIATNKVLRDFPCRISEVKCLQRTWNVLRGLIFAQEIHTQVEEMRIRQLNNFELTQRS